MKNRILFGAVAALLSLSPAAPAGADDVFVRNRPFKQVVGSGSEMLAPADQLLRALGYNWSVKGTTVTVTSSPAPNPEFPTGTLTLVYGDKNLTVDATRRGSACFIAMAPVAKFLDYSVTRSEGIVDISKARMVSEADKKVAAAVSKEQEAKQKEIEEAWAKKQAELKEKKAAKEEGEDKDKDKDEGKDKDKDKDKGKAKDKAKDKDKEKPADKTAADKSADKPEDKKDDKKNEPKPAPRLEVFRCDTTPDYMSGLLSIEAEVRNQGNADASAVVGQVVIYGPSSDVDPSVGTPREIVLDRLSVRGPALKPDKPWTYKAQWKHRAGNAMPIGTYRAELKLQ